MKHTVNLDIEESTLDKAQKLADRQRRSRKQQLELIIEDRLSKEASGDERVIADDIPAAAVGPQAHPDGNPRGCDVCHDLQGAGGFTGEDEPVSRIGTHIQVIHAGTAYGRPGEDHGGLVECRSGWWPEVM